MFVPLTASKVTIVGEGDGATLSIAGNTLKLGADTKLANLTLTTKNSGGAYIVGCFNDLEITDTVTLDGAWSYYAGHNVYRDVNSSSHVSAETATYDTVKSASSDNDCTIVINSGTYTNFMLGNRRFEASAPFGTYSGTMNVTIGENVVIGTDSTVYTGINGHNYLTGTINATLNGWGDTEVKAFAAHGSVYDIIKYAPRTNMGDVNITLADGMTNNVVVACDFNGDGNVTVADVLCAIKYCLGGFDTDKAANYYGESISSLNDVLYVFKKSAK